MRLLLTSAAGSGDITTLVPSLRWSGDYRQVARTLDFSIISSPANPDVPVVDSRPGGIVQLFSDDELLFEGVIVSRTKNIAANTIDLSCFDRGFYLNRNRTVKTYTNKTAEGVAAALASEFSIPIGHLEATGVPLSRNFLASTSIADIIITMYTLASKVTGKQYHFSFRGPDLRVDEIKINDRTLIVAGGVNLITASTTESISRMVNAVQIFDQNGRLGREIKDAAAIAEFGRLQDAVVQTQNDNRAATAQDMLDNGGVSQKMTVSCLGNPANVTGGTIVVKEEHTGLYGLFYIQRDIHEWKNGQYFNTLVLSYERLVNEREAGTLPNANGARTAGRNNRTNFVFAGR